MLESLNIINFALIEDVKLQIGEGFNVITGETGAGKSILVSALGMVLGERTSREIIRYGADSCRAEAVFRRDGKNSEIKDFLDERGLLSGDELILRRIFSVKGASRCFVNDNHVTLAALKELGDYLIDIHSQNQHQALLKKSEQMQLLDRYAHNEKRLNLLKDDWKELAVLKEELQRREEARADLQGRIEYLKDQAAQIDAAGLRSGMEDEMESEYSRLNNSEAIADGINSVCNELYELDNSVTDKLAGILKRIQHLSDYDKELLCLCGEIESAVCSLESAAGDIRVYRDSLESCPERLEEIMEIRSRIADLKRKYGPDIQSMLEYRDSIARKISDYDNYEDDMEDIRQKMRIAGKKYDKGATAISVAREKASRDLSDGINGMLGRLGMKEAEFRVELTECPSGPYGNERVEFFIRTNPGQPFMDLSKIASGGEISRIMLAVKSALADCDKIPLLVFDEIDAGIGATVAKRIGGILDELAGFHQLIVITHLPQIAGYAHKHIKVDKEISGMTTRTRITDVTGPQRIKEMARMFGGEDDELAKKQARELLKRS